MLSQKKTKQNKKKKNTDRFPFVKRKSTLNRAKYECLQSQKKINQGFT